MSGPARADKGQDYLLLFGLPNFYFHLTTAYEILRHNGVPIGKRDFLGPLNRARTNRTTTVAKTPQIRSRLVGASAVEVRHGLSR